MASLQKLSIRGIRAFSPDDDEQVIEFYSPLTIIVGANGCGKTTIIESLKYVVTGSMPPGVKSGQAFIHDPRSCNQSSVKGMVKLRFNNKGGKGMVVIRSMEVTQKKSTLTFKALDGVIRSTAANGDKISLSHKCTEMDKQIPDLIGVSSPILEHVIFLHQEDSSWPLQEGAILKKRFDEIFDSTRYAKALDAIRKSRLEYANKVKDIKADLSGLQAHATAAEGLQSDLDTASSILSNIDKKNDKYNDEIKEQTAIAKSLSDKIADLEEMKDRETEQINRLNSQKAISESQKSMLEKYLDHDADALERMLQEFDDAVGDNQDGYEELMHEYNELKTALNTLQNDRIHACSQRGSLSAAFDNNEILRVQRNSLVDDVVKRYGMKYPSGVNDASDLNTNAVFSQVMGLLEENKGRLESHLKDAKKKFTAEDDKIQLVVGELRAKQKQIEASRAQNAASRTSFEGRLSSISSQISSQSRISKSEVEDAIRQAKQLGAERDAASNNVRLAEIPKEIKKDEIAIHEVQLKIEEANEGLDQLRACSDEENAVVMLQKQADQETHRLGESCKDLLERFPQFSVDLDGLAADDLPSMERASQNLHSKLQSKKEEQGVLKNTMSEKQRKLTETSALIMFNKTNRDNLEQAVRGAQASVDVIKTVATEVRTYDMATVAVSEVPADLEMLDVDVLLRHCHSSLRDINDNALSFGMVQRVLKRLKRDVKTKDERGENTGAATCPCCKRELEEAADLQLLKEFFDREMNAATCTLVSGGSNAALQEQKVAIEKWIEVIEEHMAKYKEGRRQAKELAALNREMGEGESNARVCEGELEVARREFEASAKSASDLETLHSEVTRLLQTATGVEDKRAEVKTKKAALKAFAPSSDGKSLREVEREVAAFLAEKESMMKNIQDLNKEMSNINRQLQLSTTRAAAAEKAASDKEQQYAAFGSSDKQRSEIREGIARCNALEAELREQEAPLRQEIGKAEAEKARLREAGEREEAKLNSELAAYNGNMSEIASLNGKIGSFNSKARAKELEDLEARISKITEEIRTKTDDVEAMEPQISSMKDKIGDRDRQKKIIVDNITYRKGLVRIVEMEEELEAMSAEIAAKEKSDKSSEQYRAARVKIDELKGKVLRNSGQRDSLTDQVEQLKGKLNSKDYKNIAERHRETMIQFEITSIAVADLEKYHAAVDKALLRYHSLKIEDINKIIKELWSLTYKGQDITNIRIVSGNEGAASNTTTSRSYNYRVVMSKGNTEMDMRGRCSAGQRVLASIVIRLALAETFCINCGVLALDEPTTNLDYENKRGLAIALAQIIASRSAQHNFQLIAITHDEDFVSMMKQELSTHTNGSFSMPESYFYISRKEGADGKHYSKIEKVDWEEL